MAILYLVFLFIVFTTYTLIKRTDEKKPLISTIGVNFCILISWHIFITYIYYIFNILCTITNLSIPLIILEIFLLYKIIKKKEIQKYYIKKTDLIFCSILLILIILVAGFKFNWLEQIDYNVSDAEVHYRYAFEFYKNSKLLFDGFPNLPFFTRNPQLFLTGAYCNVGILFKCFSHILDQHSFFKLFEGFDLCSLFLMGMLLYSLLSKKAKNIKQEIFAIILGTVFTIGYPLLSIFSGFQYLTVALNIIISIIIVNEQREESNKSTLELYIVSFLLNFGLFFSYGYFVPVVYLAILANEIKKIVHNYKKEKKFYFENISYILYTLIIPAVIGIYQFVLRSIILNVDKYTDISSNAEGIYNQNYSFYIFIPFIIYYFYKVFKEKKYNTLFFITIWEMAFVFILYVGFKLGKVSEYYYYKSYYLMWILTIYITFICTTYLTRFKIPYIISAIYIIMIFVSGFTNNSLVFWSIYNENIEGFKDKILVTKREINTLKHINDVIDNSAKIHFLGVTDEKLPSYWKYDILDRIDYISGAFFQFSTLEYWLENEYSDTLICFKYSARHGEERQQEFLNNYGIAKFLDNVKESSEDYTILENSDELLILKKTQKMQ